MIDASLLIPGETRIRDDDGFCGTVVYVGPVASAKNTKEVYAGISWDDTSRGKHDGSVICRTTNQLVRHFACGLTQGSFLRLHKIDLGVALDAGLLKNKYVERQAPVIAPNNVLPHSARTSSGRDKPIEFLGELQIRERQQLEDLDKISLRREGISGLTTDNLSKFAHIKDMDLAGNLLSNWKVILDISQQFPSLTSMSLACNRIRDVELPVTQLLNLQVLNLNSCSLSSFATIQWIDKSMPNLQELCVAYSDLRDIESFGDDLAFPQLQNLDCSSSQLSSWSAFATKFSKLPQLQQLSLDDNPIPAIPESTEPSFVSLKSLQLAGAVIASWKDLEGINSLNIQSLRLKKTPLTATMGQGEARSMTIARVPTLQHLNASAISTKERIEAERRYVSLVTRLLAQAEDEQARGKILSENFQFPVLQEKHKDMIVLTKSQGDGSNLASSVCNVQIISMAASSCSMEPLQRRLPGTLQVGRLKALCARAFGLDVDCMSLYYRTEVRTRMSRMTFEIAESENGANFLSFFLDADGCLSHGIRGRQQYARLLRSFGRSRHFNGRNGCYRKGSGIQEICRGTRPKDCRTGARYVCHARITETKQWDCAYCRHVRQISVIFHTISVLVAVAVSAVAGKHSVAYIGENIPLSTLRSSWRLRLLCDYV